MTELAKILAYVVAVVFLGALLAPPLYWAGQWAVEVDLLPALRDFAFSRYLNRGVMMTAVVLLLPLLFWLGIRRWADLGLRESRRRSSDLVLGAVIALLGLWGTAGLVLASGRAAVDEGLSPALLGQKVAGALLTAVLVAVIEEIFFRGALFGVLRRRFTWPWALGLLSLLFGLVHFIRAGKSSAPITEVSWQSGFALLPSVLAPFADPVSLLSGLATLVLFGWILGYTVVRTGSLFMAVGLHGGWVFALRVFSKTTHPVGEPDIWLGRTLRIGLIPMALLFSSLAVIWWLFRRRDKRAIR